MQSQACYSSTRLQLAGVWSGHPIVTVNASVSDGFRSRVTLTFDRLTSWSMRAEILPGSMRIRSLVLIARVDFLLEL